MLTFWITGNFFKCHSILAVLWGVFMGMKKGMVSLSVYINPWKTVAVCLGPCSFVEKVFAVLLFSVKWLCHYLYLEFSPRLPLGTEKGIDILEGSDDCEYRIYCAVRLKLLWVWSWGMPRIHNQNQEPSASQRYRLWQNKDSSRLLLTSTVFLVLNLQKDLASQTPDSQSTLTAV